MRNTLVIAIAACLGGCAVGPDYEAPQIDVPPQFANATTTGFSDSDVQADFWRVFNEPVLDDLVEAALDANKDLEQARANLLASRAARRIVGFDSYPTITAGASKFRVLQSEHQLPGFTRAAREFEETDAGFDAAWELDFFGRVRRGREAARADEQAAAAEVRSAQVTITAEVARNYFVLRGLQEQLDVATRNAENQRQTLALTQVRLDAGRGTELDRSRAEAQLKTTLASIPPLRASIATTTYRLSVLTGSLPDALSATLMAPQPLPALPQLNAIGNPDALLRRRPDIRSAERNLAAATARVGIAVGDLFPRVTFFGSVGYNAARVGDLSKSGTDTYSYGPSISWAAFDLGRVRARIDVEKAQTQASLAAYEGVVLAALEETEGALVTYGHAQSRRATLEEAAAASSKAASLARQRFEGGLANFLDVLDAERDALSAQDSLAQSRTQTATSLIAVYKALGGGWTEE
jgi:multidrug efflux system outer membrane protein